MKPSAGPRHFATTQWSLVSAARPDEVSRSQAGEALEKLCRTYWYPLYAFVRSRGFSAEDAQDLTQSFFARILETGGFATADRSRGRFRSYLLGAMKHFLANEWHRDNTQKRGGRIRFVEIDAPEIEGRYSDVPAQSEDPDLRFDSEWALEIVSGALRRLREEMVSAGKGERFELLKGSLTGETGSPREEIADRLGISEGALKVAVFRLRQRYRELLRGAVAETVSSQADLDEEMRYLVGVLRKR